MKDVLYATGYATTHNNGSYKRFSEANNKFGEIIFYNNVVTGYNVGLKIFKRMAGMKFMFI